MSRTSGRHGSGQIGEQMGAVSGFVLAAAGEPTLYIAGDAIWCEEVRTALEQHQPDVVVVNAGAAQLAEGDPITMTAGEVIETARFAPDARVVAVHMEAINHCLLTRADLRTELEAADLVECVLVPVDGGEAPV